MLSLFENYVMSANCVRPSEHSKPSVQFNISFTFIFLSMLLPLKTIKVRVWIKRITKIKYYYDRI